MHVGEEVGLYGGRGGKPRIRVVTGCGNPEEKLIGTYKGDLKLDAKQQAEMDKNPMAAMVKGMLSGMKLELKKEHKYTLTVMIAIEGTWKLDGEKLELQPVTIMGMPAADVQKQAQEKAKGNAGLTAQMQHQDASKPMILKVGSDGTLTVEGKTGAAEQGSLTFKKEA